MSTQEESPSDPDAPRAKRDPPEAPNQAVPDEIEQVIARTSAKYIADLRALSEELIQQPPPAENERGTLPAQTGPFERQREVTPTPAENVSPGIAGPEAPALQAMPIAVSPIDQLRDHVAQLEAQQEPAKLESEVYVAPPANRTRILFMLCGLAVLIVIGIILFRSARARDDERGSYIGPAASASALPLPSATASTSRSAAIVGSTAPPTLSAREPSPPPTKPVPTAGPPSAMAVLQQVAAAEAALRTGQLEAMIDYGNGTRSSAQVRFDLGTLGRVPRLHIITIYQSATGTQTVERITIGDRAWQRQPDGPWAAIAEQEGAWGQVQTFLPHATSIMGAESDNGKDLAVLRWYNAGHDADVTLSVDPATGVPRELRQVGRTTGEVLTVTYSGWNTAVEITPPVGM